jgi:Domain of unknown function (DUF4383)
MNERSPVQAVAMLVGIVFLVVGILGFIPGITTNYGDMAFAGEDSESELLGLFRVSILHNIVHLLFGVAGIVLARTWDGARNFLIGGGAIYLALWLLGIIGGLDWLPANDVDHWLHFVLGLGMVGAGVVTTRGRRTALAA